MARQELTGRIGTVLGFAYDTLNIVLRLEGKLKLTSGMFFKTSHCCLPCKLSSEVTAFNWYPLILLVSLD